MRVAGYEAVPMRDNVQTARNSVMAANMHALVPRHVHCDSVIRCNTKGVRYKSIAMSYFIENHNIIYCRIV